MGTADTGHLRKFLITNVVHMNDSNHFNPKYVESLNQHKQEYHLWKTELTTPFTETHDATIRNLKPNFETIKQQN